MSNFLFKWCKACDRVTEWVVNKKPHSNNYGLEVCKQCGATGQAELERQAGGK